MKPTTAIIGGAVLFIAGYLLRSWTEDTVPLLPTCCGTEVTDQFCKIINEEAKVSDISLDQAREQYQSYLGTGDKDTLGFSISLATAKDMIMLGGSESNIMGYRLYPGIVSDTQNTIILAPLNAKGEESNKDIKVMSASRYFGLIGPCPPWCLTDETEIPKSDDD